MKRKLYDLTDEPFAMFVNRVGEVLRDEGINHNIVGGVAVQSYALKLLIDKYGGNVLSLIERPEVRIQDYIRSTDDVDVAMELKGDEGERILRIKELLPQFNFDEVAPTGESIVEVKPARIGISRPTFRVYVDGQGSDDQMIAMNIGRGRNGSLRGFHNGWYSELIKGSRSLNVPYCEGFDVAVNVPRLEHLLATKIAGSRAKDLMDIHNLAQLAKEAGVNLDHGEMSKMLLPDYEDSYLRFLSSDFPGVKPKLSRAKH